MHQIQHAHTSKTLSDHMRQDANPALRIHLAQPTTEDIIQLHQTIDEDKNIRDLELLGVPEEHPGTDADIADGVIGNIVTHEVELGALGRFLGVEFPEVVEPGKLEELLGGEEAGDEERLRGPEGDIAVVDVFHVRGREHAVLLSGEVVEEGGGGLEENNVSESITDRCECVIAGTGVERDSRYLPPILRLNMISPSFETFCQ